MTGTKPRVKLRQRLVLLFFAAFLVSAYAWRSASRVPWESGRVRVLVLEILPPDAEASDPLRKLNGAIDSADATLRTAEAWLANEYASYAPSHPPLTVSLEVSGPHAVAISPPDLSEPDLGRWELMKRAFAFYWYYRGLARDLGADFGDYDARVVVLLDGGGGDAEAMSLADRKQRFGVVHLDPEVPDPNYALVTVLHELMHALGATDKYDPDTFLATWPEGFVQPHRDPVFPQEFAEIMAVDIPLAPKDEREPERLAEVRVGVRTAAEIGWIPAKKADAQYEGLPRPD